MCACENLSLQPSFVADSNGIDPSYRYSGVVLNAPEQLRNIIDPSSSKWKILEVSVHFTHLDTVYEVNQPATARIIRWLVMLMKAHRLTLIMTALSVVAMQGPIISRRVAALVDVLLFGCVSVVLSNWSSASGLRADHTHSLAASEDALSTLRCPKVLLGVKDNRVIRVFG